MDVNVAVFGVRQVQRSKRGQREKNKFGVEVLDCCESEELFMGFTAISGVN